ncbi:hypothetical protein ACWA1F_23720 [Flavobacterium sp. 3-218]
MESINKLIEMVKGYVGHNKVIITIKLNKEKVSTRFYEIKNNEEFYFRPRPKEYREFSDEIYDVYISLFSTKDKFNSVIIEIPPYGKYTEKFFWDSAKEKKDLLDGAEVFYQWVNERMMSMIFEFEKDNNLIPTHLDSDGDLEYLSSWDRGIFTFYINEKNNLEYKVLLTQDGKERILDLPLKDYFVEGILDHYLVTNNELSDEWKPWNTMILKSLHYDIPYDKKEEFVNYILK